MAVFDFLRRIGIAVALLVPVANSCAADEPAPRVVGTQSFANPAEPGRSAPVPYELRLTLAVLRGSGWDANEVLDEAKEAARLLGQCAIRVTKIDVAEVDGPDRYRTLYTPVSRGFVAQLGLPKPTVFFVAQTRHRPAFDAEAIGRGNSRTRPEMADTVWIVRGARDLAAVIAHELVHVLSDSGEHSEAPGNLMREDTSPGATQLAPAQCDRIVGTGVANGLLRAAR